MHHGPALAEVSLNCGRIYALGCAGGLATLAGPCRYSLRFTSVFHFIIGFMVMGRIVVLVGMYRGVTLLFFLYRSYKDTFTS